MITTLQSKSAQKWISAFVFMSFLLSHPSQSGAVVLNAIPGKHFLEQPLNFQKGSLSIPLRGSQLPVTMLFSEHANQSDGVWVRNHLEKIFSETGKNSVNVWLENAQPALIPETLDQLERQFPLERIGNARGWHDAFASGKLTPFEEKALRKIFDYFEKFDRPLEGLEKTGQPFFREINQALKGKKVNLYFETPSFEAYQEELRKDMMGKMVFYWLLKQNYSKALGALATAYSYWEQGVKVRDRALSGSIAELIKRDPKAVTVVVRGLAHESTMKESFALQKILSASLIHSTPHLKNSDFKNYLLQYRELPSSKTPSGQSYLLSQFFKLIR